MRVNKVIIEVSTVQIKYVVFIKYKAFELVECRNG